jgi:glutamate-1-semialdehyde 2,1-aminomutase
LLARAGSGLATFGISDSPGVPEAWAAETLVLPYNDAGAVEQAFGAVGEQIACVIVEPVAGNMGVVPPRQGFLESLRRITRAAGALLIFDEVITGFRVAYGGAQGRYHVTPDLTTLGKVIGGGLPVGAVGGRREIMERIAPLGPVYQAGTLSGNPVACAAGTVTLRLLKTQDPYPRLEQLGAKLEAGLRAGARAAGVPLTINRVGSMLTAFFTGAPVTDWASAAMSSRQRYREYFHAMLDWGVYLAPSQFEAAFLSAAHTEVDVDTIIAAAGDALKRGE